ncbi:hypothetical protein HDU82_006544, partial [Entophlyctis luteolus]
MTGVADEIGAQELWDSSTTYSPLLLHPVGPVSSTLVGGVPARTKGRPRHATGSTTVSAVRAQQNREAARRYRARKDDRITALEHEVAALRLENAHLRATIIAASADLSPISLVPHPTVSTHPQPAVPLQPLQYLIPNQQQQLVYPQSQSYSQSCHQTALPASSTFPDMSMVDAEWVDAAASELLGTPQLLATRLSLHALPSLKDCKFVDEMLDYFLMQSQQTDCRVIRQVMLKILKLRDKMLAVCTPEDRVKALEIIEYCKVANKGHVAHLYETGSLCVGENPTYSTARSLDLEDESESHYPFDVVGFKHAVLISAPSVKGTESDLTELCDLFVQQAQCSDRPEQQSALFFRQKELENRVLAKCGDVEERKRVALVMDNWRRRHKEREDAKRPKGRPRNPDGATSSSALRAQQNREAALRYRARKDDQIRSLSARVALLEAENAQLRVLLLDHSITVPPSLSLPATAAPTGKQLPQVQQHQNQAALTPTIPANQTVILSPSSSGSEWIDKPASEILGLPQVLTTRLGLHSLPSLKNCRYVDDMLDGFVAQAQETEVKKIRQHMINILRFKDKMLAACSPEELVRALEIMEHCKITNMQHMIHLYESGSISTKIAEQLKPEGFVGNDLPIFQLGTLYSPEVASFKESVIAAAASMTSFELLDELCDLFM